MILTLAAASDCACAGAVCTAGGRRLQSEFNVSVPGPAALWVADARTRVGDDASIDFQVALARASSTRWWAT